MELKERASFNSINQILHRKGFVCLDKFNWTKGNTYPIPDGVSGFWIRKDTSKVIYVSTHMNASYFGNTLIRTAKNERDYFGGANHWASTSEELVDLAIKLTN